MKKNNDKSQIEKAAERREKKATERQQRIEDKKELRSRLLLHNAKNIRP